MDFLRKITEAKDDHGYPYDFSGQTAIVTGGARGIGRAVAAQLVRFGAQVWIWDINPVELDGAHSLTVDVTKADQIAKAVAHIVDHNSQIDILVNNAGHLGTYQPFEQFDPSEWQRIVQVNLIGVFELTRQVLPVMRRAGRGWIVKYGLPRRQRRIAEPRSLFGGECRRDCVHKSAIARGLRHWYSRELCRTRSD